MTPRMRLGLGQFNELTDEKLTFIKQLGADDFLMNTPKLPGETQWAYEDLLALPPASRCGRSAPDGAGKCAGLLLRQSHARPAGAR